MTKKATLATAKKLLTAHCAGLSAEEWTYEQYWNVVLGANRSPSQVVGEFDLTDDYMGLDEWLGLAEAEAARVGGLGGVPKGWGEFHPLALAELRKAIDPAPFSPEGWTGSVEQIAELEQFARDYPWEERIEDPAFAASNVVSGWGTCMMMRGGACLPRLRLAPRLGMLRFLPMRKWPPS